MTYSSDAMTTRPCSYDSNHIVKFRGNSNKGKTILKSQVWGVDFEMERCPPLVLE